MSLQSRFSKFLFRTKIIGWTDGTISQQRIQQEKVTSYTKLPVDTRCQPVNLGSIEGEWIEGNESGSGVILYLHGGAYILGSINTHREFAARLAHATQTKVLIINYRLAPEHPYPAALEDTNAAYQWLLDQGYKASQIFLAGDSAGGGLALAALISLRDQQQSLPAGAVCISPWTDLALTGKSYQSKTSVDCMLNLERINTCAGLYAGDHDRKNPLISPLYADLHGLPPLIIQVGSDELLLDDAVQFDAKVKDAGGDVILEIWDRMFHVFQIVPFLPESKNALGSISRFILKNLKRITK